MIELPNKKYQIIYVDPPWKFRSKQYQDSNRDFKNLNDFYNSLTIEDLKKLNITDISNKNCALFMWCTDSHLPEGIDLIKTWGFEYKTIAFVWLKKYASGSICKNFAPWTLKSTEICLLGIKGQMSKYKISNNIQQFVEAERTIHSKKPDEVRNRIVYLFGDIARIELFARQKTEGWDVWGDEVL